MYFHSQTFLYLFLPFVLAGYHLVPWALRLQGNFKRTFLNSFLFVASLFFYAWGEKEFIALLLASLIVNYAIGHWIAWSQARGRSGRGPLALAVLIDLGLLVGIKYSGFLVENISPLWQAFGGTPLRPPQLHLPIGISFFTFQAISYVMDVYRREVPAERSFLQFGLYVFLFPHLIAGPIVRYRDIAAQLSARTLSEEQFASGVHRFVIGLAKKVLLADTLARAVDAVFLLPAHELTMSAAWLGMIAYALQIYFDFSGYSDMAIGLGRMFGFDFLENFRHPYSATSVTDFWRRWHISLSSWFRDYVYIPLGGNRNGPMRTCVNLLIVFLLCGIWHGANWTFLVWGLWHGSFLILERTWLGTLLPRLPRMLQHAYALLIVLTGWAFFRAESLSAASAMIAALFGFAPGSYIAADFLTGQLFFALTVGSLACLPVVTWVQLLTPDWPTLPEITRLASVCLLLFASMIWLAGNTFAGFIYFRF